MRWRVEINERSGDERLLRDVLEKRLIQLHEQEGKLFLMGDPFEVLETAGEVHALASGIQSIITEVGEADSDFLMGFKIGHVLEVLGNGELRRHFFLTARSAAYCFAGAGVSLKADHGPSLSEAERQRIEEEEKEAAYQKKYHKATSYFASAFKDGRVDERVLQVQRLLRGDLNPLTMGHIHDLIENDIGGRIKDLSSGNQLERFRRSINHPDVFDEHARHIVSAVEPPPNPMSLDEVRVFIRDLANRWLENKAGLSPLA